MLTTRWHVIRVALAICALLGGQFFLTRAVDAACPDLSCNINGPTWNHIMIRHCSACDTLNPLNSEFLEAYCGGVADAIALCNAVVAAADCHSVVQPNGRIAATGTLADGSGKLRNGCTDTDTATVIFDAAGNSVVTQFPGTP